MSRNVALSHAGHWTCEARWHAAVQEKGQNVSIIDYFIGNHQLSYRPYASVLGEHEVWKRHVQQNFFDT